MAPALYRRHTQPPNLRTSAGDPLSYMLERGVVFRSVAVGPKIGRLYLFGNRDNRVVVTVLDPHHGRTLARWTARQADHYDWMVYRGVVARDERQFFISYHGSNTTDIDSFVVGARGLRRCQVVRFPNVGCLPGHGDVEVYGDHLLASTSTPPGIIEFDRDGRVLRRWNTRLVGNHLTEFAVDAHAKWLYAVGSCGYTGGLSVMDMTTGGTRVLARPGPPQPDVCGERLTRGSGTLLVVGRTPAPVLQPDIPGVLLFLDVHTGTVLRSRGTPAEPIDVTVAGRR